MKKLLLMGLFFGFCTPILPQNAPKVPFGKQFCTAFVIHAAGIIGQAMLPTSKKTHKLLWFPRIMLCAFATDYSFKKPNRWAQLSGGVLANLVLPAAAGILSKALKSQSYTVPNPDVYNFNNIKINDNIFEDNDKNQKNNKKEKNNTNNNCTTLTLFGGNNNKINDQKINVEINGPKDLSQEEHSDIKKLLNTTDEITDINDLPKKIRSEEEQKKLDLKNKKKIKDKYSEVYGGNN